MFRLSETAKRYVQFMAIISLLCLGLFGLRVILTGTTRYYFIPENLALAWLGLIFGWLLANGFKSGRWNRPSNLLLALLWLVFLPNCWYVLTDFIHVRPTAEISQLYDIVAMFTLVFAGFIMGFTSLFIVHREVRKRRNGLSAGLFVAFVLLLSSFAIYLGRDLRWNTWDVITNPTGVILNVSDRIIDPLGQPRSFTVTLLFFVTLSAMYLAVWRLLRPVDLPRRDK